MFLHDDVCVVLMLVPKYLWTPCSDMYASVFLRVKGRSEDTYLFWAARWATGLRGNRKFCFLLWLGLSPSRGGLESPSRDLGRFEDGELRQETRSCDAGWGQSCGGQQETPSHHPAH